MTRPKVFVSYSHHDSEALAAFQPFLKPLERDGLVRYWDDTRLKGGDDWYAEIEQALAGASVAVLFISQPFLASDFIVREELPRLLAREHAGQLQLLPVFLSPSTVADEDFSFVDRQGKTHTIKLVRQQGYGTPHKPLSDLTWSDRQREYTKLSQRIRKLAGADAATARLPDALPASRVTSYQKPPPQATAASRAESINYELTVQLERHDETLVTRYYLPGSDAIAEAARPWSSLAAPPGSPASTSSIAAIAAQLDTQCGADLQRLLDAAAGEWGERLFDLLFGPESQWEGVLRGLFDRPSTAPRPTPLLAAVRLRIATDEPLLLGLPWRLTAWRGTPLVDRDWEFSTGSVVDPRENPVTPAPAGVLIIAPQGGADGLVPDPAQVQAIVEVLQKVWPSRRQPPEYLRIVRTRSELDHALRGMPPHLLYVVGHGAIRGGRPSLLFDAAGDPDLPLTQLAASLRNSPTRPAVIYLNVSGLASSAITPVAALAGVAQLLIWRRLPEREADANGQASAWLQRWLQRGEDPLSALHQTNVNSPGADAATVAAHSNYRLWTTHQHSLSSAPGLPHLTLDRDEQKALVAKHLREFVRSDTLRVMALVACATPGNLLGFLPEQLQHYLDLEAADCAESNWRRLQFPVARQNLLRDLEHELKLQLHSDGSEPVRHLLRRHAPNVKGLAKRGVLWLNWGFFGAGADGQPPLTPAQMGDWIRFSSEFVGAHCSDDLRIVSFLAIELEAAKHLKLAADLESQLWKPWCTDARFRLDPLPPLGSVTERHLFTYLLDKRSACDTGIRQEVTRLLIARTGGEFAQVVALIEEAQNGSWYDLLEKLRHEQSGPPITGNNDTY